MGTPDPAMLTGDFQKESSANVREPSGTALGPFCAVTSFLANRPVTVEVLGTRTYNLVAGERALKPGLFVMPGSKLEDVYVTAAP